MKEPTESRLLLSELCPLRFFSLDPDLELLELLHTGRQSDLFFVPFPLDPKDSLRDRVCSPFDDRSRRVNRLDSVVDRSVDSRGFFLEVVAQTRQCHRSIRPEEGVVGELDPFVDALETGRRRELDDARTPAKLGWEVVLEIFETGCQDLVGISEIEAVGDLNTVAINDDQPGVCFLQVGRIRSFVLVLFGGFVAAESSHPSA